jgi:hypothetical protein
VTEPPFIRKAKGMSPGRVAQLVRQRPDATAVFQPPPPAEPVFDPDLWTPPNQRPLDVQYASVRHMVGKPKRKVG